jgi:hypothetical protein
MSPAIVGIGVITGADGWGDPRIAQGRARAADLLEPFVLGIECGDRDVDNGQLP